MDKWLNSKSENKEKGESVKKKAHPETPKCGQLQEEYEYEYELDSPIHALTLP